MSLTVKVTVTMFSPCLASRATSVEIEIRILESATEISASDPILPSVRISIVLLKLSFLAYSIAHSECTHRSALLGSLSELTTFWQSFLWIETP